jgi:hypothetical protein
MHILARCHGARERESVRVRTLRAISRQREGARRWRILLHRAAYALTGNQGAPDRVQGRGAPDRRPLIEEEEEERLEELARCGQGKVLCPG